MYAVCLAAFVVGPLLLGLISLTLGLQILAEIKAMPSWPQVRGEVKDAIVYQTTRTHNLRAHAVRVTYDYIVLGQRYTSSRIILGQVWFWTKDEAEAYKNRFTVGMPVDVHYKPSDPRRAVLEPRGAKDMNTSFVAGVALIATALVVVYVWLTTAR